MKVLADLHHFDLYYSLQLLFEKRLGWELYRPIGLDWKKEGYWAIHSGQDDTAECYLSKQDGRCSELLSKYKTLIDKPWGVYGLHLPRIGKIIDQGNGIFKVLDRSKDIWQQGITFDAFKANKFDILLSSTPAQVLVFSNLVNLYQPQAKLIFQMGNRWPIPHEVRNLMVPFLYPGCETRHSIVYHQEFNLSTFCYSPPRNSKNINAYVWFPETEALMDKVAVHLPDLDFRILGITFGSKERRILRSNDLARTIQDSLFTWIIKPGGEGYGHILFNSFACGRPLIIQHSDYIGSAGDALLEDGKTCIFLDSRSPQEIARLIREALEPDNYNRLCCNVKDKFDKIVDFDKEFIEIKQFLERLQ